MDCCIELASFQSFLPYELLLCAEPVSNITCNKYFYFQAKFMPFSGDCHVVSCARDGQIRLAELSLTGVCKGTKKLNSYSYFGLAEPVFVFLNVFIIKNQLCAALVFVNFSSQFLYELTFVLS
jgi:hypothetical protein